MFKTGDLVYAVHPRIVEIHGSGYLVVEVAECKERCEYCDNYTVKIGEETWCSSNLKGPNFKSAKSQSLVDKLCSE